MRSGLHGLLPALLVAGGASHAQGCGEVLAVHSAAAGEMRASFVPPSATAPAPITLLLLPGGGGHARLDAQGCAQQLKGNSLIRALPYFQAAGLGTALVDAPAAHQGADGLGGYRAEAGHANDLGQLVAALRQRTGGTVWVVGTSRGAISAANAAARLSGASAPDGAVLTSAVMSGQTGARKAWVAQTVFDVPLQDIALPLLVLGHAQDRCERSPPSQMQRLAARTRSTRMQVIAVNGGPGDSGAARLDACEGRTPHGFIDQEADMASGIARFVRGGIF